MADAVKDIITHSVQINQEDVGATTNIESEDTKQESFLHVPNIEDRNAPRSLAAQVQNDPFLHAAMIKVPRTRFSKKFYRVNVGTGEAQGSSTGITQYHSY